MIYNDAITVTEAEQTYVQLTFVNANLIVDC